MKPYYYGIILLLFLIDFIELHLQSKQKTEIERQYAYTENEYNILAEPLKDDEEIEIKKIGYSHMLNAMNPNSGEVLERVRRITFKMPEARKNITKTGRKSEIKKKPEMFDNIVSSYAVRGEAFLE